MIRTLFLSTSNNNVSITAPFAGFKGTVRNIWLTLACSGTAASVVSCQVSQQNTSTLAIDASGAQYSDSLIAILVAHPTVGNPITVSQRFTYSQPLFIPRGFSIYTINTGGDTFDIAAMIEFAL